jgi:hypothetical protein
VERGREREVGVVGFAAGGNSLLLAPFSLYIFPAEKAKNLRTVRKKTDGSKLKVLAISIHFASAIERKLQFRAVATFLRLKESLLATTGQSLLAAAKKKKLRVSAAY